MVTVRIKIKRVTVVRDQGHTLGQWWRGVCWTFSFPFPTIQQPLSSCSDSIARGGLPFDQRTKYIDNQIRPNLELHSFLHRPPFVLPTPFHDISILVKQRRIYCKSDMILASLLTVVLASLTGTTSAQDQIFYDATHNATGIAGTWSSGAQNVLTGPVSFLWQTFGSTSFIWPLLWARVSQIQPICRSLIQQQQGSLTRCACFRRLFDIIRPMFYYCFSTNNGFYEISRYRFNSNGVWDFKFLAFLCANSPLGSQPTCITGVVVWVHGTYVLNPNGSISMTPFGDGYQQVQDPCAAVSNFIQVYNETEYYESWRIFLDPTTGYHLHLFAFNGEPINPQFLVSATPNMLPTQLLRNVTVAAPPSRRSLSSAENLLGPQWTLGVVTAAAAVLMALAL